MVDGICPKCHQPEVRERMTQPTLSLQQQATLRLRFFVCVACGYTETYTHAEHLSLIANSADWRWVRATQRPSGQAPATGATIRLQPPSDGQAPQSPTGHGDLSPKKRCPACQSEKLVPGARVLDRNQTFSQNLTVEVDRNPDALVFRGNTPSDLRAWVCSRCGYTSLFADRPEELYTAYQAAKR